MPTSSVSFNQKLFQLVFEAVTAKCEARKAQAANDKSGYRSYMKKLNEACRRLACYSCTTLKDSRDLSRFKSRLRAWYDEVERIHSDLLRSNILPGRFPFETYLEIKEELRQLCLKENWLSLDLLKHDQSQSGTLATTAEPVDDPQDPANLLSRRLDEFETLRSADLSRMNALNTKLETAIEDANKAKSASSYQSKIGASSTTYSPLLDELLESEALRKLVQTEAQFISQSIPVLFALGFLRTYVYNQFWAELQGTNLPFLLQRIESAVSAQLPH